MKQLDDLQEMYAFVEKYSHFAENDNCNHFLDVAEAIILCQERESVGILLSYFDEDRSYGWVYESLMISMEAYPREIRIKCLLEYLPFIIKRAPSWTSHMFLRIINNADARKILIDNASISSKYYLTRLIDSIVEEYPDLIDRMNDLKKSCFLL